MHEKIQNGNVGLDFLDIFGSLDTYYSDHGIVRRFRQGSAILVLERGVFAVLGRQLNELRPI